MEPPGLNAAARVGNRVEAHSSGLPRERGDDLQSTIAVDICEMNVVAEAAGPPRGGGLDQGKGESSVLATPEQSQAAVCLDGRQINASVSVEVSSGQCPERGLFPFSDTYRSEVTWERELNFDPMAPSGSSHYRNGEDRIGCSRSSSKSASATAVTNPHPWIGSCAAASAALSSALLILSSLVKPTVHEPVKRVRPVYGPLRAAVTRAVERFLKRGILHYGFARLNIRQLWTKPLPGVLLSDPPVLPFLRRQGGWPPSLTGWLPRCSHRCRAPAGRLYHPQAAPAGLPQEPEAARAAVRMCLGDAEADAPGSLSTGARQGAAIAIQTAGDQIGWHPHLPPWFPTRSGRATDGACRSVIWTRTR